MPTEITRLLRQWSNGDAEALNELMPLVYPKLRALAGKMLRSEQPGHTLSPTAVVHELYLRLAGADAEVCDQAHFAALAATIIRHLLLDWAKGRNRAKRSGGAVHETLREHSIALTEDPDTILEIDRLLDRLGEVDARKVKVVEMIFFGGMTYEEAAVVLGVSAVTVHRELKMAKAWMLSKLQPSLGQSGQD